MAAERKKYSLGLNLDDYKYEDRHCDGQNHCRWIDFNYVTGVDFSWRCPSWQAVWPYAIDKIIEAAPPAETEELKEEVRKAEVGPWLGNPES